LEESEEKGSSSDLSQEIKDSGVIYGTKIISIPQDAM
jgi:hypothetical protein